MLKGFGLVSLALVFGTFVVLASVLMGNDFPVEYAKESSIEVLATILALNVATATFLIGSLLNIEERVNDEIFNGPRKEIKHNLVVMAVLFLFNVILVALIGKSTIWYGVDIKMVLAGVVFAVLFFYIYLLLEIVLGAFKMRVPKKQ